MAPKRNPNGPLKDLIHAFGVFEHRESIDTPALGVPMPFSSALFLIPKGLSFQAFHSS